MTFTIYYLPFTIFHFSFFIVHSTNDLALFVDGSYLAGWDTGHEGEVGDILGDNSTCGNHGTAPHSVTTDDGAVGT